LRFHLALVSVRLTQTEPQTLVNSSQERSPLLKKVLSTPTRDSLFPQTEQLLSALLPLHGHSSLALALLRLETVFLKTETQSMSTLSTIEQQSRVTQSTFLTTMLVNLVLQLLARLLQAPGTRRLLQLLLVVLELNLSLTTVLCTEMRQAPLT
jgi:hypothetical protein